MMKKRNRVHVRQANVMCREYGLHDECTGTGWDLSTDDPCPCPCPCHTKPSSIPQHEDPLWDDM